MFKAIRVEVYRGRHDCTNNGISSRYDYLLVECADGNVEIDEADIPDNFCSVYSNGWGEDKFYYIEPFKSCDDGCVGWMSGGNFAYTSDARFAELVGGRYAAINIHDRQETTKEHALYSL